MKTSNVIAILSLLLLNNVSLAQQLPDSWKLAISLHCKSFSVSSSTTVVLPITTSSDDLMLNLCPSLLIWSPIEQLHSSMKAKPMCPTCTNAMKDSFLSPSGWLDGSTDKAQPRKVHDSHGIMLLVSRIYKCSFGHEVYGHDPCILEKLPSELVPFLLWHKTGVTKHLVDDISTLLDSGIPITSIESLLLKRRRADYVRREAKFLQLTQQVSTQFPSFSDWSKCFSSISPGWHMIQTCYKVDFDAKKELYDKYMQQVTVINGEGGAWLSCDHTFASAGTQLLFLPCS